MTENTDVQKRLAAEADNAAFIEAVAFSVQNLKLGRNLSDSNLHNMVEKTIAELESILAAKHPGRRLLEKLEAARKLAIACQNTKTNFGPGVFLNMSIDSQHTWNAFVEALDQFYKAKEQSDD